MIDAGIAGVEVASLQIQTSSGPPIRVFGDGVDDWLVLYNTIRTGANTRAIGNRGAGADPSQNFSVGYNTIDGGDRGAVSGLKFGGIEQSGFPIDGYLYNNTVTGIDGGGLELSAD